MFAPTEYNVRFRCHCDSVPHLRIVSKNTILLLSTDIEPTRTHAARLVLPRENADECVCTTTVARDSSTSTAILARTQLRVTKNWATTQTSVQVRESTVRLQRRRLSLLLLIVVFIIACGAAAAAHLLRPRRRGMKVRMYRIVDGDVGLQPMSRKCEVWLSGGAKFTTSGSG